jgi:protein-L-isoaspartate(D-aspartate) O-methyltransferase
MNGRVEEVPQSLLTQLADGGRLVAVVGSTDVSRARVYTRTGNQFADRDVFDASVPKLAEFNRPNPGFTF